MEAAVMQAHHNLGFSTEVCVRDYVVVHQNEIVVVICTIINGE